MVLQKWLKGTLCAVAMAMMAGPAGAQPASSAPAARLATAGVPGHTRVATVNGEDITYAQLEPVLKHARITSEMPEAERRESQREALSMLIDDLLLQQFL